MTPIHSRNPNSQRCHDFWRVRPAVGKKCRCPKCNNSFPIQTPPPELDTNATAFDPAAFSFLLQQQPQLPELAISPPQTLPTRQSCPLCNLGPLHGDSASTTTAIVKYRILVAATVVGLGIVFAIKPVVSAGPTTAYDFTITSIMIANIVATWRLAVKLNRFAFGWALLGPLTIFLSSCLLCIISRPRPRFAGPVPTTDYKAIYTDLWNSFIDKACVNTEALNELSNILLSNVVFEVDAFNHNSQHLSSDAAQFLTTGTAVMHVALEPLIESGCVIGSPVKTDRCNTLTSGSAISSSLSFPSSAECVVEKVGVNLHFFQYNSRAYWLLEFGWGRYFAYPRECAQRIACALAVHNGLRSIMCIKRLRWMGSNDVNLFFNRLRIAHDPDFAKNDAQCGSYSMRERSFHGSASPLSEAWNAWQSHGRPNVWSDVPISEGALKAAFTQQKLSTGGMP